MLMRKGFILFIFLFSAFSGANAQVVINELCASKQNVHPDRYNEYDDWVEFYNASDTTVNIAGWYLSDKIDNPTATQIDTRFTGFMELTPGAFLVFHCDKGSRQLGAFHLNLKLSSGGESLYLFNQDTVLVDSITFPRQPNYISYGRLGDDVDDWGYFTVPTPNSKNGIGYLGFCNTPQVSVPGGIYNQSQTISISCDKSDQLWYTLDGTVPNPDNGTPYTTKLVIDTTTVLRVIALHDGELPSEVVTHTYFIGYEPNLPVFSLATDHIDLITNTDPTANVYDEKPIHVEFYEQDGTHGFSADMGFKLVGKAIRNYPQKSMAFKARGGYGTGLIEYPLFAPQKDIPAFEDFILRNSGNDNSRTLMRDGFMQTLMVGHSNVDGQAYQPCIVFVNGQYWGIHNLREKISGAFVAQNHPETGQDIDLFEWGSQPIQGTMDNLTAFDAFVAETDFSLAENYDSLCQLMDMANFIDYQIAEIYYGNTDWPMANMKFWRPRADTGKWRWIIFDVDLAYDLNKKNCPGHHNTVDYALGINNCHLDHLTSSLEKSTVLLQKLVKNEQFLHRFINRFCDLLNTTLSSESALETLDSLVALLEPEMPNHIERWGTQKGIKSMGNWQAEIDHLRTFAEQRPDTLRQFLALAFDIGEVFEVGIPLAEGKQVTINGMPYETDRTYFYFTKVPVLLTTKEEE